MCVTFTPAKPSAVQRMTGVEMANTYSEAAYPGYAAPIIRKSVDGQGVDVSTAVFGLIPAWAKERNFAKRTYNARSETVAEKPSYRGAWRARRFCLVPMQRFYEPCWETGRAVQWNIHRRDEQPFAVAAIWEDWTDRATGEVVTSFSMLTVNADGHEVMGRFHRVGDERRSLVIVQPENWSAWLTATTELATAMLLPMNPAEFTAHPVPPLVSTPASGSNTQADLLALD